MFQRFGGERDGKGQRINVVGSGGLVWMGCVEKSCPLGRREKGVTKGPKNHKWK